MMGSESLWSLEMIINDVKRKAHTDTKTLNETFLVMINAMGISASDLQNATKRYKFSREGYNFWYDALAKYTEPPYKYIREKDYDNLSTEFIDKYINMVTSTMKNVGKSDDEIEYTLQKIDECVDYSKRLCREMCDDAFKFFSQKYMSEIFSKSFLLL